MTVEVEFGYYPESIIVDTESIKIKNLPELDRKIAEVSGSSHVEGDWIYAPHGTILNSNGRTIERPYQARIFGLPKTHSFEHSRTDDEGQAVFLLWVISFILGIRLTSTQAGFLDATPIRPGTLVDFILVPMKEQIRRSLELAEVFWADNRTDREYAKGFTAAVHALFLGQSPQHLQFESFMFLYIGLDACYALAAKLGKVRGRLPHKRRIGAMCDAFAIRTPEWADAVACLRNFTLHEGIFVEQPLGFGVQGMGSARNILLEMQCLICRLLVAMLGASDADYIQTPIDTRQLHILDLR
jgi:hypothetical protein